MPTSISTSPVTNCSNNRSVAASDRFFLLSTQKFCFLFQKALSNKILASNWDVRFEDSVKIKHLSPFITVCFSPVAEIYALCYSLKIEDLTGVKMM